MSAVGLGWKTTALVTAAWLLWGLSPGAAQPAATLPDAPCATAFFTANEPPLTSYRARRHLEASNQRFNKSASMEAMTELSPQGFTYQVLAEEGSGLIRNRVLRAALEGEKQIVAGKDQQRSQFTLDNYRISCDGTTDEGLVRVKLEPLRQDKLLVRGALLLRGGAELVAVTGQLAKGPSWWTPKVEVQRRYIRVGGVRVASEIESTSHVRLVGASRFRMTYTYEMVNGTAVPPAASAAR
jgi:hypothetical protein